MRPPHPSLSGTISRPGWQPIVLGTLLRIVQIWMPVVGVHSWRQADTAAMARHFVEQGTPIWLPQIDWAGASAGYVECEFPIYPFLVSRLYGLVGIQEWMGRSLSILCSALTIWLVMRLGRRWFNPEAGWWAGMAFAVAPLGVYYGRAFQAEALLVLCAAGALEAHSIWVERQTTWALAVSWICFAGAALIKVIPLLWLGLPMLLVQLIPSPQAESENYRQIMRRLWHLLLNPWFWVYSATAVAVTSAWYMHAFGLGETSGLTFGFWGEDSDRSNIGLVLSLSSWTDLAIRIGLRALVVVGIPLIMIGTMRSWRLGGGIIAIGGVVGMLICTIATMRSSTVHEYYQFPLLLFSSPLVGLGWQTWNCQKPRWVVQILISVILSVSLLVLTVDYWAVEIRQRSIWMPLAETIRRKIPSNARIVSITGSDPTLLNLARRQGWIIPSNELTRERLKILRIDGASHLTGSTKWHDTYTPTKEAEAQRINQLIQTKGIHFVDKSNKTYLIPISDLIP